MSLPISTPPNAIAFSKRAITTREMAWLGSIISIVGIVLLIGMILLLPRIVHWL